MLFVLCRSKFYVVLLQMTQGHSGLLRKRRRILDHGVKGSHYKLRVRIDAMFRVISEQAIVV